MLVAFVLLAAAPGNPGPMDESVIYCSQQAFHIPLDLTDQERQQIKAVRLYYSEDRGGRWLQYTDVAGTARVATFRTAKDGEYWFSLAMVDHQGRQDPADMTQVQPGLKVIVDTTAPVLTVTPIVNREGRQGIKCEVSDACVDPASLRVAVWSARTGGWAPYDLPMGPQPMIGWFDAGLDVQKVQAVVKDRAGNQIIRQIDIYGDRFSPRDMETYVLDEGMQRQAVPVAQSTTPDWPAGQRPAAMDQNPTPLGAYRQAASAPMPTPVQQPPMPSYERHESAKFTYPNAGPAPRYDAPAPPAAQVVPAQPPADTAPRPENVSMMNSKGLMVEYDLDYNAGGSRVELWGSRDRGFTWAKLAVDPDSVSPIEGKVPQDGLWGLKVVVVDERGSGQVPTPGTAADMYVDVDSSAPFVELAPPEVQNGQVVIQWNAKDSNIGNAPIHLLFAPTPNAPRWNVIAENLENTGKFVWPVARAGVTGPVYIRIEAEDKAGNVGFAETSQVTLNPPQARVVGVRPQATYRQ